LIFRSGIFIIIGACQQNLCHDMAKIGKGKQQKSQEEFEILKKKLILKENIFVYMESFDLFYLD